MKLQDTSRSLILSTSTQSENQYSTISARLFGSSTAGILELMIFHPVDTIAKRLMTNTTRITTLSSLNTVIFKQVSNENIWKRYFSLFPGLGFAAGYKISQRIYKFGGQPILKDYLSTHYYMKYQYWFGERHAKTMLHATAGSLIGIGEIILLPLDILKIRAQTNPSVLAGRHFIKIVQQEKFALYRGASWTAARNAPGSFALFGGSAACKEYCFGLKNYNDATFMQNFIASIAGASASILVAQPLDVIKTRIQTRGMHSPESGYQIIQKLLANEGPTALFKGVIPKLSVVGPKLVFSFTVAQHLIAYLETTMKI